MKNYQLTKKHLKQEEGVSLTVYRCTEGHRTIGWGHKLPENSPMTHISLEYANKLFEKDFNAALFQAYKIPFFEKLSEPRQCVILNMIFQLGYKGTLKFKKTLRFIEEGNYTEAAQEIKRSKLYSQTRNRVNRLAVMLQNDEFRFN